MVVRFGVLIYNNARNILYKYLKNILNLRPSTPNFMIYGDVSKLPLQVTVDKTWKQRPGPNIRLALFSVTKIILTVCFKMFGIELSRCTI